MKTGICRLLVMAALLIFGASANAAVSCNINSSGFFSVYDGLATTDNLNQSSYTLNCTRLAGDPATLNYIAFTDDGLYNNGARNRAKNTAINNFISYDFFTSSSYTTNWSKSQKCIIGTLNFGTSLSGSQTQSYYSRIPAGQTGIAQGSYIDTVTVSVSYNTANCVTGATPNTSGTFQVQISNMSACQIAIPPGTVAFDYTAFAATSATASTTFSARCSTTLPYTMALDANLGVVSGLNYSVNLSATQGTGNGALQTYSINGIMAAGQAGTCSSANCTATDPRQLIITY